MSHAALDTRSQILSAALSRFAEQGYAGTSVQQIVDAAHVTKPALYYHFRNKADLYRALVEWAMNERYRLMREAVAGAPSLPARLTAIGASLFRFIGGHRELMRLAFAAAFAAPGEVPPEAQSVKLAWRNIRFIQDLFQQAFQSGELPKGRFNSRELAMGFAGMLNLHVMACLVDGKHPRRGTARRIVQLFLSGAGSP